MTAARVLTTARPTTRDLCALQARLRRNVMSEKKSLTCLMEAYGPLAIRRSPRYLLTTSQASPGGIPDWYGARDHTTLLSLQPPTSHYALAPVAPSRAIRSKPPRDRPGNYSKGR